MTDSERIARLEKKASEQDQRLSKQDQRLIEIEKNGVGIDGQTKQNTKDINRVEDQTLSQFEQLIDLMNAGFNRVENNIDRVETNLKKDITNLKNDIDRVENILKNDINRVETNLKSDINRVETNLKNDINRVEGQTIKWLSLIIAVAVIILSAMTYFKG